MRESRGVGTGGPDHPLQHGKAQRCRSPQEYWFGTFGKAQSYRGRVIIRPLAKKIIVKTLDLDSPERNSVLSAQVYCNDYGKRMRQTCHWK